MTETTKTEANLNERDDIAQDNRPFLVRLAEFVKFSHTIFALPFALVAMFVAADGFPHFMIFVWILVCMVTARTIAMIFNRIADWQIDQENPRTSERHTLIPPQSANWVLIGCIVLFTSATLMLNTLCVLLAPVAIALICFYSLTKRFTSFSHLFLGLALSAAPVGAWAAVTGDLFTWIPFVLGLAVLCWVFGFDLIYATQDADFDRKAGLYSIPSRYGVNFSLRLAAGLHVVSAVVFAVFGVLAGLSWGFFIAWALCLPALIYEHQLSATKDLSKINKAFFEVNAIVSILLLVGTAVDVFAGWRNLFS